MIKFLLRTAAIVATLGIVAHCAHSSALPYNGSPYAFEQADTPSALRDNAIPPPWAQRLRRDMETCFKAFPSATQKEFEGCLDDLQHNQPAYSGKHALKCSKGAKQNGLC